MKKLSVFLCAMVLAFGIVGNVNAALIDRGGGLIYDSDQNITWLQDANYAMTLGYDSDGRMTWDSAVAWADQLVYRGYDDWRLPKTVDGLYVFGYDGTTTAGYYITTCEMGYMYYVNLGNLGVYTVDGAYQPPGWGLNNTSLFNNLQSYVYWSGTEQSANINFAWFFYFRYGGQGTELKDYDAYAWAVRDGDVVPIPGAIWLLGSGLIGLVGFRRKIKAGT